MAIGRGCCTPPARYRPAIPSGVLGVRAAPQSAGSSASGAASGAAAGHTTTLVLAAPGVPPPTGLSATTDGGSASYFHPAQQPPHQHEEERDAEDAGQCRHDSPTDLVVAEQLDPDADDQFAAAEITNLISPIIKGQADAVFGSRFLGSANFPLVKRIIIMPLARLINSFFGIKLSDPQSGFRALNRKTLEKIKIDNYDDYKLEMVVDNDAIKNGLFDLNINDSIKVNVLKFRQKIFTKNKLSKSRTSFQINYYLSDGKLFYVKVEEQSPNLNDLKKHIEYGISEDKICCVNYYYDMRSCLPISFYKDINEQFGYNQSLTEEFMKDYVFKLYKKINKKFR